jgi:hypothetical protein
MLSMELLPAGSESAGGCSTSPFTIGVFLGINWPERTDPSTKGTNRNRRDMAYGVNARSDKSGSCAQQVG